MKSSFEGLEVTCIYEYGPAVKSLAHLLRDKEHEYAKIIWEARDYAILNEGDYKDGIKIFGRFIPEEDYSKYNIPKGVVIPEEDWNRAVELVEVFLDVMQDRVQKEEKDEILEIFNMCEQLYVHRCTICVSEVEVISIINQFMSLYIENPCINKAEGLIHSSFLQNIMDKACIMFERKDYAALEPVLKETVNIIQSPAFNDKTTFCQQTIIDFYHKVCLTMNNNQMTGIGNVENKNLDTITQSLIPSLPLMHLPQESPSPLPQAFLPSPTSSPPPPPLLPPQTSPPSSSPFYNEFVSTCNSLRLQLAISRDFFESCNFLKTKTDK